MNHRTVRFAHRRCKLSAKAEEHIASNHIVNYVPSLSWLNGAKLTSEFKATISSATSEREPSTNLDSTVYFASLVDFSGGVLLV